MTRRGFRCGAIFGRLLILLLVLPVAGCQGVGPQEQKDGERIQAGSSGYAPGLSVVYIDGFFRHIDQVPTGATAVRRGRRGAPVLRLDHRAGREGQVFASGRSRGVAMLLQGMLHLSRAGAYRWQALANDGIRMTIDQRLIFEDPAVHGDRLTPVGVFHAPAPGWYPVSIVYFQRKGTSALRLYWQPPGADGFTPVPAAVYGH